jgi:hypothetical protein
MPGLVGTVCLLLDEHFDSDGDLARFGDLDDQGGLPKFRPDVK